MNSLKILSKLDTFDIWIEDYKIIFSDNYNKSYQIIRSIDQYFTKTKLSERQSESNYESIIYLNEKLLSLNLHEYYFITQHFDVKTDLKLQSKSLILKYFETALHLQDITNEIETLNVLLNSIADDISNEAIPLFPNVQPLSIKSISKLFAPYILLDEMIANEYDFNYNEIICFQLNLLREIEKNELYNSGIVIVDLPILTREILDILKHLEKTKLLIFTSKIEYLNDITKIHYLSAKTNIDLADDEQLYDSIINKAEIHLTKQEVLEEMKNIIELKHTQKTTFIKKLL